MARGHFLWLQPARAAQRYNHARPGRLGFLSRLRYFPDSRTGPPFWRPDSYTKRALDKRVDSFAELKRVNANLVF